MRDIPFLRQGVVPQEESGAEVKDLDYQGEEHEKLNDDDVSELAQALMGNSVFSGEVQLGGNDLTDLSALHLSKVLEKQTGHNITKLNLDGSNFTSRAGEYIGEALLNNPDYPIKKLSFSGICFEEIGLGRIIEAVNANSHIKRLVIGVLTDDGLKNLARLIHGNQSLEEIKIQETNDPQKLWTAEGRGAFTDLLRQGASASRLKHVDIKFERENHAADDEFKSEIRFYTKMVQKKQLTMESYCKVLNSCDPKSMFD